MNLPDHFAVLAALGGATLVAAWLPSLSRRLRVSGTILLLLLGFGLYQLGAPLAWPDPFWPDAWTMAFTEAVVIISLMSAGLKVGRSYRAEHWRGPARLLLVTMPLCILAGVLLGHYLLGLPIETAVLLGAVLAPTDPVMASEVQIEPTDDADADYDPIRFTLTGEASLNDGLAYPFTWLAVLLTQAGGVWGEVDWAKWVGIKFCWKIAFGVALGAVLGFAVGKLLEKLPQWAGLKTRDGFVAFATTFFVYGLTELLGGYGFLAVFAAGLAIRYVEEGYAGEELKFRLHDFTAEVERVMLAVFLVLFGGSIFNGLLGGLDWRAWGFAVAFIFVIRPLAGRYALAGGGLMTTREKWAVGFLGIRGIGSLFYLTWAFLQADFPQRDFLYQVVGAIILVSLLSHGLTARTLLAWADPDGEGDEDEPSYEIDGPEAAKTDGDPERVHRRAANPTEATSRRAATPR